MQDLCFIVFGIAKEAPHNIYDAKEHEANCAHLDSGCHCRTKVKSLV